MNKVSTENMSITINHETRRTMFSHWGLIDKQSVLDSYEFIYAADGFNPDYSTLVDYRDISEVNISAKDIKEILGAAGSFDTQIRKYAILVQNNIGRYALSQLYCVLSSALSKGKAQRKAFRNLQEAEAWLDSDKCT